MNIFLLIFFCLGLCKNSKQNIMSKNYFKFQKLLKISENLYQTLKIPMNLLKNQNRKIHKGLMQKIKTEMKI